MPAGQLVIGVQQIKMALLRMCIRPGTLRFIDIVGDLLCPHQRAKEGNGLTWEERGTIIYLYNGILNGIQVRLLPETLKREAGVNPAQCRCCIGGAVLIGHWGYALGRREPRWMPESEYLPVYDAQEASPVQGGCSCL